MYEKRDHLGHFLFAVVCSLYVWINVLYVQSALCLCLYTDTRILTEPFAESKLGMIMIKNGLHFILPTFRNGPYSHSRSQYHNNNNIHVVGKKNHF